MHVLIATPTTNGTCFAAHSQSVADLANVLHAHGASYRYVSLDGADVVTARNLLTHRFLSDPACDHILFLDSDMAINPAVFRRMLAQNAPIIGAAYTERGIDLDAYHRAMAVQEDPPRARALASRFTVRMSPGEKQIHDNVTPVDAFGFGCVLIRRAVFDALIASGSVERFRSSVLRRFGTEDQIWDFFAPLRTETGEWMSEDYAFCHRVRALGDIPLYAYIGPGVGHVGHHTFGAPYIERLKAGKI